MVANLRIGADMNRVHQGEGESAVDCPTDCRRGNVKADHLPKLHQDIHQADERPACHGFLRLAGGDVFLIQLALPLAQVAVDDMLVLPRHLRFDF